MHVREVRLVLGISNDAMSSIIHTLSQDGIAMLPPLAASILTDLLRYFWWSSNSACELAIADGTFPNRRLVVEKEN